MFFCKVFQCLVVFIEKFNAFFKAFVSGILDVIIANKPCDLDALMALPYDADFTVEAKLKDMIFTIGENINIRRFVIIEGAAASYIHGKGNIGVVVKMNKVLDNELFAEAEAYALEEVLMIPFRLLNDGYVASNMSIFDGPQVMAGICGYKYKGRHMLEKSYNMEEYTMAKEAWEAAKAQ